jgi:hypothetical protein
MLRRTLIAIASCVALAGAGTASAQDGGEVAQSWAQVNICSPTQLGARAQLAGDGSKSAMSVRFTAQWLSPSGWVPLNGSATSPWEDAGSAPAGFSYQLRAVAELQWAGRSQTIVTGTCAVG